MAKRIEVIISGLGGQGVVLAGEILGRAAVYDGKHVVQTQSYGAEARGSVVESGVIISDEKIDFPMVRKCDVLVVMNQSVLDKHVKILKENGTLLVDENMVENAQTVKAKVFRIPATKVAKTELKSKTYANLIMLGALTKVTGMVSEEAAEKGIIDSVSQREIKNNLDGFKRGFEFFK